MNNWHFLSTFSRFFVLFHGFIRCHSCHCFMPSGFHFWISVIITTLRKVAFIIYSNDKWIALAIVCGCVPCARGCDREDEIGIANLNVPLSVSCNVYFSVVIIVSINLYWQPLVNFLLALSSAFKRRKRSGKLWLLQGSWRGGEIEQETQFFDTLELVQKKKKRERENKLYRNQNQTQIRRWNRRRRRWDLLLTVWGFCNCYENSNFV